MSGIGNNMDHHYQYPPPYHPGVFQAQRRPQSHDSTQVEMIPVPPSSHNPNYNLPPIDSSFPKANWIQAKPHTVS